MTIHGAYCRQVRVVGNLAMRAAVAILVHARLCDVLQDVQHVVL